MLAHSSAMRLVARLLLLVVAVAAKNFEVHSYDSKVPACVEAECSKGQLCLIKAGDAICIPKEALKQYVKQHHEKKHQHTEKIHKHVDVHEHAKHDGHEVCTEADLAKIGGRLLAWFDAIHQQSSGVDRSLPAHHVLCRPSSAWMFQQWDGNQDGFIDKEEAKPMENTRCIAQYLDKCDDMTVDGKISIDEWCDCFSYADDERHEPPCHKAKHAADPHMQGAMIPRCDLEGFYRPEQCHEGHCWCVDKFGREFQGSRVNHELPDCGQYSVSLTEEETNDLRARM